MMHEPPSFEDIYREYMPKVSAYVSGKIKNRHDAEELVSTVFFKVHKKLDSFNPEKASISTWIYTITRNTVTDHFRTRRTMVEFADYMLDDDPSVRLTDDALEDLADALLTLKERERDLVILRYYKGYTLKDAADLLGMSYSNAKIVHQKALSCLRLYFAAPA